MNKKFFIITGLLFCGTLLIPVLTEAQSNLTNTPTQSTKQTSTVVTFEDANLEATIRETLNIPIDEITSADMQRLTFLNINNKNISSLKGLEYATNLQVLKAERTNITSIEPVIKLGKLKELTLAYTPTIKDFHLLNNLTQLQTLWIHNCDLQSIDFLTPLTKLTNLSIHTNSISNILPLKNMTELTTLYAQNNQISNIEPLHNLTKLSFLQLQNNQIENIQALEILTNLNALYLNNNQISNIESLNNLTKLTTLYLNNNQISNIESLNNLTNLSNLQLQNNQISNIESLNNLTNLSNLQLQNNQISNIEPLNNLTNLTTLYLTSNSIDTLSALKNLTKLKALYVNNNNLTSLSGIEELSALTYLNADGNRLNNLEPLRNLNNLTNITCYSCNIYDASPLENLTSLTAVALHDNRITDLSPLANLTNITYLGFFNNKVSDLSPLINLKKLKGLEIHWNKILDFSPLNTLITEGNLTSINSSGQSGATSLPYKNNRATNPFRHPDGSYAEITNLPKGVTQSKDLSTLNFETITEGDTYSFRVSFGSAKITLENPVSFKDQKFKQAVLKSLGEKERVFPSQLTQLTELDLSNAQIESLEDLRHFPNLTTLNIENNAILDFSPLETYGANLTQVSLGKQCGELKVIATDGMTFENPLKNLDKTFVEIYNDDSRISIADDFSTFTVTYDVIKERQSTFRFNGKNGFNGTATFILNGKVSQLPEDIAINGTIEPTILSIRVPSEINYTINPNLTPSVVVPSFELTNETVTPLTVEVETISSSMGGLSLTPLTTYTDEEWSTLPKNQAHQIGLGLTTTTQIIDLSQNTKQSLDLLSNTQPLELALVVKHSQSISESNQLSLTLRFTFGLLD